MSAAALKRIEDGIAKLAAQQADLCARLEALEQQRTGAGSSLSKETLLKFLDGFRAAEALGEESHGSWIEVSDYPMLRGGLRTIAQRESMHARLLEQRIVELGGTPTLRIGKKAAFSAPPLSTLLTNSSQMRHISPSRVGFDNFFSSCFRYYDVAAHDRAFTTRPSRHSSRSDEGAIRRKNLRAQVRPNE
jgi:hypothetical protein